MLPIKKFVIEEYRRRRKKYTENEVRYRKAVRELRRTVEDKWKMEEEWAGAQKKLEEGEPGGQ